MHRRPLLHRLPIQSAVVFRARHLGDMLCAVPALRALRTTLPKAHIALVGLPWAAQFVDRFSAYLDEFLPFPGHPLLPEQAVHHDDLPPFYARVCAREFSLALQLHGSDDIANHIVSGFGASAMAGHCRGKRLITDNTVLTPCPETGAEPERLLHLAGQLGAPTAGAHLEFPILPEDEEELAASGVATGLEPRNYICVHPGARQRGRPTRRRVRHAHRPDRIGRRGAARARSRRSHARTRHHRRRTDLDRRHGCPDGPCAPADLQ